MKKELGTPVTNIEAIKVNLKRLTL